MANIDTPNKRRSVKGIAPVPDGTIDANDRKAIAGIYWGQAGLPVTAVSDFIVTIRRRRR